MKPATKGKTLPPKTAGKRTPGSGFGSKLTPEMHEAIIKLVEQGNYYTVVAKAVGLSPGTLNSWIYAGKNPDYKAYPNRELGEDGFTTDRYGDLARDIEAALAVAETNAVQAVSNHFDRDWRAAAEFLSRRFPDRWNPKQVVEQTTNVDVTVKVEEKKEVLFSKLDQMVDEEDIAEAELVEPTPELEAGDTDDGQEQG